MRVIAGSHKGRRLQPPSGVQLRPTSGRVKEALFSILAFRVKQACMLDLFAGSGAIGLEALSRGAKQVIFVEQQHASLQILYENLNRCDNPSGATVLECSVWEFFRHPQLPKGVPFDIVFADPPYEGSDILQLLSLIGEKISISPQGVVIVEHLHKASIPLRVGPLSQTRRSRYGDTALTFFEATSTAPPHANRCVPRNV